MHTSPAGYLDPDARGDWKRRAIAIGLALLLEGALLLLLLTLGVVGGDTAKPPVDFVKFTAAQLSEETPAEPEQASAEARASAAPEFTRAEPDRPVLSPLEKPPIVLQKPVTPSPAAPKPAPQITKLDPKQMAAADISKIPANPKNNGAAFGPAYGPADTGTPGDSQRVSGSSPTGEPLYAARWYREPSDAELAGYLSSATGPGYAIIACKTAPNFRIENCVLETESPSGSQIGRSVLAAAWQFQVRPPRIGGRSQIGAWVRIKIDYQIQRR